MEDKLITVAIHTHDRAHELRAYLESEGIPVKLQNINLSQSIVASGIGIRIKEVDLPKALRLIENAEIFTGHSNNIAPIGEKRIILVPVDFSKMSEQACFFAFSLASFHKAEVVLLHSFIDPTLTPPIQLSDSLDFEISENEIRETLTHDAENKMQDLFQLLRTKIKNGELPVVKFSREIIEGLPEEVINEYSKSVSPFLIVMGTRGVEKKEKELIGSITAEVLDTCRTPVLTLPENINITSINKFHRIALFCTLDQSDLIVLGTLSYIAESGEITLVVLPTKRQLMDNEDGINSLLQYCGAHYPQYQFSVQKFSLKNIAEDFSTFIGQQEIELLAVPNKKKNAFARLFNPGLAHRLLFRADIPMIVLPV